ncbi:outer membrane beta-barrel protein [Flavobacterium aciduliphilum]|nr:outer membrane beta-barrel protein [Flavobacterium aciduliphilum]
MKKILLVAAIALSTLTANAQDKKESKGLQGAWFATAQVGYLQSKTGDLKNTNTTILPIVGTFVSPSVALGVGVGNISMKSEAVTKTTDASLLVVQPLARKYYNVAGGLYFFGQAALPIISGKEKVSDLKVNQFGVAISSGFDYFVTKSLSVEFSYNLVNFSQTTLTPKTGDKTTTTDFSLAHVATVDSSYNLSGAGVSLTTPLSFGFKFIF